MCEELRRLVTEIERVAGDVSQAPSYRCILIDQTIRAWRHRALSASPAPQEPEYWLLCETSQFCGRDEDEWFTLEWWGVHEQWVVYPSPRQSIYTTTDGPQHAPAPQAPEAARCNKDVLTRLSNRDAKTLRALLLDVYDGIIGGSVEEQIFARHVLESLPQPKRRPRAGEDER